MLEIFTFSVERGNICGQRFYNKSFLGGICDE